jgi:hypothetical protein
LSATNGKPLTTGQLARIFRVAPRTVSKWTDGGLLRCERLPGVGNRRVEVADAVEFCRRRGWRVPPELSGPVTIYVGCDGDGLRAKTALEAAALAATRDVAGVVIDVGEVGVAAALDLCRHFAGVPVTVRTTEDAPAGAAFVGLGCTVIPPRGA